MVEKPNECPVEAIKLYISKLPKDINFFFLKPKPAITSFDTEWYYAKCPIGKNVLGDMMKRISLKAQLSQQYTNHAIRATVVTTLSNQGYTISEIQCVTGHKNPASVERYTKKITTNKKMKISHALTGSMNYETSAADEQRNIQKYTAVVDDSIALQTTSTNTEMKSLFQNCTFSSCTFNIK